MKIQAFVGLVFLAGFLSNAWAEPQTRVPSFRVTAERIQTPDLPYSSCLEILRDVAPRLATFNPRKQFRNVIGIEPHHMRTEATYFQNSRSALQSHLGRYANEGVLRAEDVPEFRRALRLFRTFDEELSVEAFRDGDSPTEFLVNPALVSSPIRTIGDLKKILRNGDIIISRGRPEKSVGSTIATIAAQTISDSHFSHAQIVRVSADGVVRLEALIEDGTKIRSWEDFEKTTAARFMILRFNDAGVAEKGTEALYAALKARIEAGNQIRYNFSMKPLPEILPKNLWDLDIVCSQPACLMVKMGSDGKRSLPLYQTALSMRDDWFLRMLGIENNRKIEHPGDFEVDPQLTVVAEYRDLNQVHDAYLAQATMSFIFEKLNAGFRIEPTFGNILVREGLWRVRRLPGWMWKWIPYVSKLEKAFPEYITQDQIQAVVSLQNVFIRFFKELKKCDDQKWTMGWDELQSTLNKIYSENRSSIQTYFYMNNPEMPGHFGNYESGFGGISPEALMHH